MNQRTRLFLSRIAVVGVILGGVYFYLFTHLVRLFALVGPQIPVAAMASAAVYLLTMVLFPLAHSVPRHYAVPLHWLMYTWLGTVFLMLSACLLSDIAGLFLPLESWGGKAGWFVLSGVSMLAIAGLYGARRLRLREVEVAIRQLPATQDGLSIVQLTDLHVGATLNGEWLRRVVARVNALSPDVIAITGDLIDGSVAELAPHVVHLRDLRATHGVFFVTGNHEYYSGADAWVCHLASLGVRVLRNERVPLGEEGLELAGIDDFMGRRLPGHGPDLISALADRDAERPVVLLAHQPRVIDEAAQYGVDLVISGHTHGGQIWPFRHLVPLQQPYITGLHWHKNTATQIYISAGTGYWGPPMRLGTVAEITRIILRRAD